MADFFPGQNVVCCVSEPWDISCFEHPLVVPNPGHVYTVRSVVDYGIGLCLHLHWLINPPCRCIQGLIEPAFAVKNWQGDLNFRPVVEHKTDIGLLEKLLLRKDVRIPETV